MINLSSLVWRADMNFFFFFFFPSQVKVWLGDNADHYYVLSRFLLSRMLTVTKVLPSIHFLIDFHQSSIYIVGIVDIDVEFSFI